MEYAKSIFASKVFWVAVAQLVLAALAIFTTAYPQLQTVGGLLILKSFLDIYLRTQTSTPIAGFAK